MVAAALVFSQGAEVGEVGAAYIVDLAAGAVHVKNNVDTGVTTWTFILLDAPYLSAIAPGVLSTGASSSINFSWDVAGSYRIQLTTSDGTNSATDIRNIIVPSTRRGWFFPSFQTTAPEMNFPTPRLGGTQNARGWAQAQDVMLRDIETNALFLNDGMGAASGQILSWNGTLWVPVTETTDAPAPPTTIAGPFTVGATQTFLLFTGGTYAINWQNAVAGRLYTIWHVGDPASPGTLLSQNNVTFSQGAASFTIETPQDRSQPLTSPVRVDGDFGRFLVQLDVTNNAPHGVLRCIRG